MDSSCVLVVHKPTQCILSPTELDCVHTQACPDTEQHYWRESWPAGEAGSKNTLNVLMFVIPNCKSYTNLQKLFSNSDFKHRTFDVTMLKKNCVLANAQSLTPRHRHGHWQKVIIGTFKNQIKNTPCHATVMTHHLSHFNTQGVKLGLRLIRQSSLK